LFKKKGLITEFEEFIVCSVAYNLYIMPSEDLMLDWLEYICFFNYRFIYFSSWFGFNL